MVFITKYLGRPSEHGLKIQHRASDDVQGCTNVAGGMDAVSDPKYNKPGNPPNN